MFNTFSLPVCSHYVQEKTENIVLLYVYNIVKSSLPMYSFDHKSIPNHIINYKTNNHKIECGWKRWRFICQLNYTELC